MKDATKAFCEDAFVEDDQEASDHQDLLSCQRPSLARLGVPASVARCICHPSASNTLLVAANGHATPLVEQLANLLAYSSLLADEHDLGMA